jgi:DNA-binding response OmpR family regulator
VKTKIAYIDDDLLNLESMQLVFEDEYLMDTFSSSEKFLEMYPKNSYDCILLDIHMPVMDGFTLYERIIAESHYNGCPILFISSDESDQARIKSLTLGAVDFIGRMMGPEEMMARIRSKIQFFQNHRSLVEFDDVKVNLTQLKTSLKGKEVPLTFIELKFLLVVLQSFPDAIPKDSLIKSIWKVAHVQDATLYTHISNLNAKLEGWKYEVQSVKNKGIQLVRFK